VSADRPLEDEEIFFKSALRERLARQVERMSSAELLALVALLAKEGYDTA
jgi:hypothetical protein